MKLYTCEHCKSPIRLKLFFGNAHLKCRECGTAYQLTTSSMKIRMLEPVVSVGIAVSTSLMFFEDKTIDFKTVYILGLSFFIAAMLDWGMVRCKMLRYEKKVDGLKR